MERTTRILSVSFASQPLGLPMWARLSRKAQPLPAPTGDADRFTRGTQFAPPTILIEIKIRDVAAAEVLSPGQQDTLCLQVAAASAASPDRTIEITSALLLAVELEYAQGTPAAAVLRFEAQTTDGQTNPFSAQEQS